MRANSEPWWLVCFGYLCVGLVVGALAVALTQGPPREFPESVTVPDRSCYADRCAQALPGGLIRVTDRGGNVIGVWWR